MPEATRSPGSRSTTITCGADRKLDDRAWTDLRRASTIGLSLTKDFSSSPSGTRTPLRRRRRERRIGFGLAGRGVSRRVPFGFQFTRRGQLIVSEAGGAAPNGAASSYGVSEAGALSLVSGSVSTQQAATCLARGHGRQSVRLHGERREWVDFRFAIGGTAALSLLDADGRTA